MAKSTRSRLVKSNKRAFNTAWVKLATAAEQRHLRDEREPPRDALMRKLWMHADLLQYRLRELQSSEFTTSSVVRGRVLEKVKQQEIEDILRAISRDIGALVSLRR